MSRLFFVSMGILALNLPFGFWRGGVRRFSPAWFLSIHLPVPLMVAIRLICGIGWHLTTLPLLIGSFIAGQWIGKIFRLRSKRLGQGVCMETRPA
jgi:hypothetical protein